MPAPSCSASASSSSSSLFASIASPSSSSSSLSSFSVSDPASSSCSGISKVTTSGGPLRSVILTSFEVLDLALEAFLSDFAAEHLLRLYHVFPQLLHVCVPFLRSGGFWTSPQRTCDSDNNVVSHFRNAFLGNQRTTYHVFECCCSRYSWGRLPCMEIFIEVVVVEIIGIKQCRGCRGRRRKENIRAACAASAVKSPPECPCNRQEKNTFFRFLKKTNMGKKPFSQKNPYTLT